MDGRVIWPDAEELLGTLPAGVGIPDELNWQAVVKLKGTMSSRGWPERKEMFEHLAKYLQDLDVDYKILLLVENPEKPLPDAVQGLSKRQADASSRASRPYR